MGLNDTKYLYASSNIRASEGAISYRERLNKFLECKSVDELYEALSMSANESPSSKKEAIEAYLNKRLDDAFNLVTKVSPAEHIYDFLKYEYDCCNLKLAIKCLIKDIELTPDMVYNNGSVNILPLLDDIKEGKYNAFPQNMANGAAQAREIYAKTKNPRDIDVILDKACFEDMLKNAEVTGCELFVKIVKTRIDKANVLTFARIASSSFTDKERLLCEVLINGGYIPKDTFIKNIENYDGNLDSILLGTKYSGILSTLGANYTLGDIEKLFEDTFLSLVKNTAFIPFGAEIPCAYLIKTTYEIKNIRIILAGISSSLPQEKIRERVRFGYV